VRDGGVLGSASVEHQLRTDVAPFWVGSMHHNAAQPIAELRVLSPRGVDPALIEKGGVAIYMVACAETV